MSGRLKRGEFLAVLLLVISSAQVDADDGGPRLATVIAVEQDALVISIDDAPQRALQRIPLTGALRHGDWQQGMAVRIWPGAGARSGPRVTPAGVSGSVDRTGVRRRLSRGARSAAGSRRGASGGGRGGR